MPYRWSVYVISRSIKSNHTHKDLLKNLVLLSKLKVFHLFPILDFAINLSENAVTIKQIGKTLKITILPVFYGNIPLYMWYVAQFGTICTILKTWKTLMEECYF